MTAENRNTSSRRPKFCNVLVLRYSSLGDVVLTLPFLDALREAMPGIRISYAVKAAYAPLVRHHPAVAEVLELAPFGFPAHLLEVCSRSFDMVFDLHGSLRSRLACALLAGVPVFRVDKEGARRRALAAGKGGREASHAVQRALRTLSDAGLPVPARPLLSMPLAPESRAFLEGFLKTNGIHPASQVLGVAPGARWATKRWFPERFAEAAARIVEKRKCRLLWFGGPAERALIEGIQAAMRLPEGQRGLNLAGRLTLGQTAAVIGRCDVFLTNDSGLMHLAAARGCRVVALFGSTAPSLGFAPWTPHATVVEDPSLPCRPCHVHGRRRCPLGHFQCMGNLTTDLVEKALDRAFRRSR